MDKYLIDFHKLTYHPERIALWLKAQNSWEIAKKIYPIYVEISLSGICNHRCKFCAFDYLGYNQGFANFENLKRAIKDMAKGGTKAINFSGEGEPLLYPQIKEIVAFTKSQGIDVAIATNGSLLTKEISKNILPHLSWLRISLDAGTAETHFKIHRPKESDFERIIKNLREVAKIKKQKKYKCTLGVQFLLLPDNFKEIVPLAKFLRKIGVDYLSVKPYSQHPKSKNREYEKISYEKYLNLKEKLEKLSTTNFQVIFRERTMKKLKEKRGYKMCHALGYFWAHLATNGDVFTCGNFVGDKRFKLGNYNEKPFKEIWEGKERKKHLEFAKRLKVDKECRVNCRMDEVNKFLEKLKNPPHHVNFI